MRLTQQEREDLEAISRETGLPISDLTRRAVVALIVHAKRRGGRVTLPLSFEPRKS